MGWNKKRDTGFTLVTCSKCGAEALSKATKQHRRCGGQPGAEIRPRDAKLPSGERGTWN